MKSLLLSLIFLLTALHLPAQFSWVEVQTTDVQGFLGTCTSPNGEVFAAGFRGSPVLQQYDRDGNPGFFRIIPGLGLASDVGYDRANDRLVLAGATNGSPSSSFNGSPFLHLLDPVSGATIGTAPITGTGYIKAVDVTATYIYAVGNYSGTLTLGSFSITGGSAFVAQFDLNGIPIQAINITSSNAKGFDVKVDAADNVYFTMSTQSDVFFGTGFPGNYSYTRDEEFVLVQANAAFQAQYSQILRRTEFPVTDETEIPLALDEDQGLVYVGTPFEPNTTPTIHGGIASFDLLTGTFSTYTPLPDRTVRDLTVSCGELFAVGGKANSFGREPCNNAGHSAWFERYGTTLTPAGLRSASTCSYGQAIAADDFGYLALAGQFNDAPVMSWDTVTTPSPDRAGGLVARVNSGTSCCTSSLERCLDFDGNNDGVLFGLSPIAGRTEFTIELWFRDKGANSGTYRTLFFNGGSLFSAGVRSGNLALHLGGIIQNITPVAANRWYNLAVTYENNTLTTYLDGTQVNQQPITLSLISLFNLGQYGLTSPAQSWQGQMDEVSVYDYAKGPAEILNGIGCSPTGNETGLVLYLPLDQGAPGQANPTVNSTVDLSPSGNNGTLQNFALNGQAGNWICSDLILPGCPPDTCGAQLPVNTFSRYREHLDVGSAATDKELDLAYGAFRLPNGDIIQQGVVAGSDNHNPLYLAKTDNLGNPIGNPDLYHPTQGSEAIQLLHEAPTPIRNATGTLIGFLATGITELAGNNQQRVLLRFDLNLNLLDSRFYQPIIPGVRELFSDVIQDNNGDYIAVGHIDQLLYNSGFVMRIRPDLLITHYQKFEDFGQDIYPDKIIEGPYNFPGMFGGITSTYIVGGRALSGQLFYQGLDFNLQPAGNSTIGTAAVPNAGNAPQYLAGLDLLPDGRLALTGTDKSGQIWVHLAYEQATTLPTGSFLIDVDNGFEEAYSTALRPGNRLLIGGRAESNGQSNTDDARALLLEVDLDNMAVNWARTYGNAAYPESVILDVYADDAGVLLSGFGITQFGTTAGGFFGDLNHWDSWLAATDTLGRVFDCDCYETTFATINTATGTIGLGVSLSFSTVNPGQDDLLQDMQVATITDFYCDQYAAPPPPPVCPGGSNANRDDLADNTTLTEASGIWTLSNTTLLNGFELTIDWGDGTIMTVLPNQLPLQHTYSTVGNYSVCTGYTVYATDGTICWQRNDCDSITTATKEERNRPVVALTAYPNPTDGLIYFQYDAQYGTPSATIFSIAGQPVRSVDRLSNGEMSLTGLASGVYVVQLRFPGGAIARKRVVLR